MQPFQLIVITAEQSPPDEALLIARLFELGLQALHLRKPNWGPAQTENLLAAIPKGFHPRIVMHRHFELCQNYALQGIHLSEDHKRPRDLYEHYPIVSASFHSLHDLQADPYPYRYVFLSPLFDSISKPGYKAAFDRAALSKALQAPGLAHPVVGLGGVDSSNIAWLKAAGFAGAAVLGAVWQAAVPPAAFQALQQAIEKH